MNDPVFIVQISQEDDYTFVIKWSDQTSQTFRLSELQKNCPCAQCTDKLTGKPLLESKYVSPDVRAVFIKSVGRYALQVQFTSGCSSGIYCFDHLRKLQVKTC